MTDWLLNSEEIIGIKDLFRKQLTEDSEASLTDLSQAIAKAQAKKIIKRLEPCMAGLGLDHPEYYQQQEFIVLPVKHWISLKKEVLGE